MNLQVVLVRSAVATFIASVSACASTTKASTPDAVAQPIAFISRGDSLPITVFQAGLGDGKDSWSALLRAHPSSAAVFTYDRPGYGKSVVAVSPRDPCTIAAELHETLRVAKLAPPYVLVGHSLGGLYQYAFVKLYPNEVVGMLLIEPTHPDHWARMQKEASFSAGIVRTMRHTVFSPTAKREFDDSEICTDRLKSLPAPTVPMRLLGRKTFEGTESGEFERLIRKLWADWTTLLPGITHREVERTGHYIHKDRTDVVEQELQALLKKVRQTP